MKRVTMFLPLAGLALLLPAAASSADNPTKPSKDPNERVCEKVVPTGSRLVSRRVCATRAEWEDKKRQDRQAVDKAQLSPCVMASTGSTGKNAC